MTSVVASRRSLPALVLLLIALPVAAGSPTTMTACPPAGWTPDSLQSLKARSFAVRDPAGRRALALGLLGCLGDPDPALRDGIAYEALSHWMRAGDFDPATLRALRGRLYAMLDAPDPQGFGRPFAALVLSEVARTDRVAPWMSPAERADMVARASDYLRSVDDYRGFDDDAGWRHGVAHGADWLMQLSLNPALERPQLDTMLAAVAAQVVPANGHAYVFGEPGRLARPVLFIARGGVVPDEDWKLWFEALRAALGNDADAYANSAWLGRRHDLHAFLAEVYIEAAQSDAAGIAVLRPIAGEALKALP